MRYLITYGSVLWLLGAACGDDDANTNAKNHNDAGQDRSESTKEVGKSSTDAGPRPTDAGAKTQAETSGASLRPALPKPPKDKLPIELRPPR